MEQPKRIQRRRTKGWKMPENTVSVTRPGRWGNPFKVLPGSIGFADAESVVAQYREWIKLRGGKRAEWIADNLHLLRGKNLACFCKEGDPCHADVLLEIANR